MTVGLIPTLIFSSAISRFCILSNRYVVDQVGVCFTDFGVSDKRSLRYRRVISTGTQATIWDLSR